MPSAKGDKPNAEPDLQVGRWCVQPSLNELRDGPTVRHVEPQVMDLLVFLASRDGRVVSKDEIIDGVWEGRFIAEATLTRSIADLRRALGDSRARPQYIETIAKRGYRIVAAVSRGDGGGAPGEDAGTGGEGASAPVPEPCLIVLPFADLGPDSSPYFCDGLTDDIINALTRVSGLRVISRTSAFAVHARGADVAEIGRGLGATHAIEGSVRQAEGRLRVTAQLVDLRTHCHVWSERYDRALSDVFAIQDEIAAGIVRRLQLTLDGLAARAAAPTTSMEAYARLLEGRHHFLRGTREGMDRARQCFADAITLDPRFAAAHDALSEVYWSLGFYGMAAPRETFKLAFWESLRALEIDDRSGATHALLAMLCKEVDYDWSEVDREFARALELEPRSPVVRFRHAICGLISRGRGAEAARELEPVVQNDPLSIVTRWWLAAAYWFSRQTGRAREQAQRMAEIDARHPLTHMILGTCLLTEGDLAGAVAAYEKAAELGDRLPWLLGWLGLACGRAGQKDRAHALREELLAGSASAYVSPFAIALISIGLDDADGAFEWMDRAIEERDPFVIPLLSYPILDPLRADPRYLCLLARMNLTARGPDRAGPERLGEGAAALLRAHR
ncbi:MAG TPA: winged helix-turn-helix domain-containing protein [Vicinamibacteria bacterium]|nr:winged helix-turn-helix domain-containing protein [Vicinamibacteria bacterium]